jgi:hypothetical protein
MDMSSTFVMFYRFREVILNVLQRLLAVKLNRGVTLGETLLQTDCLDFLFKDIDLGKMSAEVGTSWL